MRIRLFQKRKDGAFYRAVWLHDLGIDQRPLSTSDKDEALRLGRALLAELLRGEESQAAARPLTLGELWNRYSKECADYLDNGEKSRKDSEARSRVLLGHFGSDFRAQNFTLDDQRQYEQARQRGGIVTTNGAVTPVTRARSAEADMVLLHAMLRWATTKRTVGGAYLLDRNPLLNVRRVREKNRKQERATWERYQATTAAMRKAVKASPDEQTRLRWLRMEFALFLAEATGRRLGSIRQLRWEDFRYDTQTILWRAEADKKGYKWEIPMPAKFMQRAKGYRRELGAISGPVFPASESATGIMDRHLFDKWLSAAEKAAELPKLDGSLWHAYRRKWATERKHLNPKDVAAAGGWKDIATLLEVYQQADEESVLAVMSDPRKLHDRAVTSAKREKLDHKLDRLEKTKSTTRVTPCSASS
jgi:integrase